MQAPRRAHAALTDFDTAGDDLDTALTVARRIANPPQLWKTWEAHGDLMSEMGRTDSANMSYSEALTAIGGVADRLSDQALRKTFIDSRLVRDILAKLSE